MPSMDLCCSKPSPSGETIACIWPWIRPCYGTHTVWCAYRSSIVDGRFQSYGESWNIQAAVWLMRYTKRCWIRWLNCFLSVVLLSLPQIVGSPTCISWDIWRGWVGTGVFVSKGVFGFIAMANGAVK